MIESHALRFYAKSWLLFFHTGNESLENGGIVMNIVINKVKEILKPYLGLPKEVYIIFIARIVNALGMFVFPIITLILTKKLGMTDADAGLWVSIFGLMFMLASVVGGKLADLFGRKIIIVVFDSLAAICYLTCVFVGISMNMIYLIMLAGMFMGMSDPAHNALIADLTTPENRDGAYSLSYLGFNMGFAIAPMVGGLLFENHLKLIFLGDGITALIATSLVLLFIGETIGKTKEDIGENRNLEKRVEGSIFKVLLSRPILIYFALISFGYNFVYSQWGFMMPLHAENNFINEGAKLYGKLASFNGFIVIVFTPIMTALFSKTKNIRKIFYGGIFYTLGFGLLGFISTKTAFFLSVFIFTLGEIIVVISFMPFIANHTPASHRGRMNAILPVIIGMGYTLGPMIMGRALNRISIEKGWIYLGVCMLVSTILMYFLEKIDTFRGKAKMKENKNNMMVSDS